MPQLLVTTRPERTSDEVAAGRKAANAFFTRYDTSKDRTVKRNVDRLVDCFSQDWNLLCCDREGRQWARLQPGNAGPAERAQAHAARAALRSADELPAQNSRIPDSPDRPETERSLGPCPDHSRLDRHHRA